MLKRLLATTAAWALATSVAFAQVNVVPQVGVVNSYQARQTYSAVWIGLVPASSATDLICISGSASKKIVLRQIKLSGSAGTTLSLPVTLVHRAALDTGGTAASTTANPANTISKREQANGAATATLISYTANPTITDSSPTYIDSAQLALSLTTMATVSIPVTFDWTNNNVGLIQPPVIAKNSTEQICVNLNSTSISSGVITGSITWGEE